MNSPGPTPSCPPAQSVHSQSLRTAVQSTSLTSETYHLRESAASRFSDYLELTKPRIAVMALITVTIGYTIGSAGTFHLGQLLHALFGISLVAVASSALNQWLEIETDRLMERTVNRPLPAGRLLPAEVLLFGVATGVLGIAYLAIVVNPLTAWLSAATLLLYVAVYTPLKQRTSLCTTIGAIPGALPPVLGWTAATGTFDFGAFLLFSILFLWQFPHFLAIAWLYRKEYAGAGMKMLPNAEQPSRKVVGLMSVAYAVVLLPVSLLPGQFALAGSAYMFAAFLLSFGYCFAALRFLKTEGTRTARGLLFYSLVYLPLLLVILTFDHLRLLQ